jgi:FlaG/FlaF family flagellin (archaellin)
MRLKSDERAVSEIIGTMLLLAMAVGLFAVVSIVVLSFLHAPASVHASFEAVMADGNVTIYHGGGDDLNSRDSIIFEINGTRVAKTVGECLEDKNNDGKWNIGEKIIYAPPSGTEPIDITVVSKEANRAVFSATVKRG